MNTPCPLCGAAPAAIRGGRGRALAHCPRCDLISVPRECHLSKEAQRARYAAHRNSIDDAGYVQMLNRPIEMLRQHGQDVRRVLDYGSGPEPVLVELLRRAGYDAVGYDPIFAADADLSGPFDAVVAVETFEHLTEPRRELERIAGLLRPGGLLIVMTLLHKGPAAMKDWWYVRDATHVGFYSTATLAWITRTFGFEPVCCDNERLAVLRRTA